VLYLDTTLERPSRIVLQHPDRSALLARIDDVRKGSASA
jgi:hypothetical protein